MQEFDLKERVKALVSLCREVEKQGARIVITGHDSPDADSIISAVMMKKFLEKFNISLNVGFGTRPDNVTERDMNTLGLLDGISFDGFDDGELLLLVDHHKSFYKNRVIASVDHHTTLPEPEGEVCVVVKASSCGRVIFDMMTACEIEDAELEKLAIYSVYLDTQSCRSPKFRQGDVEWLESGIKKYGIDRRELERMGFCLCDPRENTEVLAMYGYKKYSFGARPSFSTCVQIDPADELWNDKIENITAYLVQKLKDEDGALWAFVVNKPENARSDIYFIEQSGRMNLVALDRLASRSRDVIPIVSLAQ